MHPRERTWISRRVMVFLLLGIIAIGLGSAFGQGEKPATSEEESSDIILVVKGKNSGGELAALGGAVVNVFDSRGKQHQQKTTTNGRTIIKDLPRGKVRVQVIAPEWELFGQDYDLTQKKHEFSIEMERRNSK